MNPETNIRATTNNVVYAISSYFAARASRTVAAAIPNANGANAPTAGQTVPCTASDQVYLPNIQYKKMMSMLIPIPTDEELL